MKRQRNNVSSLPPSPDADRRSRMVKYSITMGIRFICIIAIFFVQGWWILFFAIGAVFLPYFAVIIANAAKKPVSQDVEKPSSIVIFDVPNASYSAQTFSSDSTQSRDQDGTEA